MRQKRKMTAMVIVACMVLTICSSVGLAEQVQTPEGSIIVAVEKFTLGQGYVKQPVVAEFYKGEKVGQVIARILGTGNFYNGMEEGKDTDNVSYVSKLMDEDSSQVTIPDIITQRIEAAGKTLGERQDANWLGSNDYTDMSGWMYLLDNAMASQAMNDTPCADGAVVRLAFSVYDWGADLGVEMSYGTAAYFEGANKDALTTLVAQVNSNPDKDVLFQNVTVKNAYDAANAALINLTESQQSVDSAQNALEQALVHSKVKQMVSETAGYLTKEVPMPEFFKEWVILGLARSGESVPDGYYDGYYNSVVSAVKEKNGVLSESSYTEYSRTILALTALGKDVTNVGGYDLLSPLADYDAVIKQGLNGAIYALLALDTHDYEIPKAKQGKTQTTRESLVDAIIKEQLEDGGFAIWGSTGDVDSTAMAIQALAKYKTQPEVAAVIDDALTFLSGKQLDDGGFAAWGSANSNTESAAQVILALSELGIDARTDERFIKAKGNLVDNMMSLYVEGGGFKHVTSNDEVNSFATQQAMYAMVGYQRLIEGSNSLYDMTDTTINVSLSSDIMVEKPVIAEHKAAYHITATQEREATIWVALYQDGVMEKVVRQPIHITAGSNAYEAEYPAGYERSIILLWSGTNAMQPVAQSTIMGE